MFGYGRLDTDTARVLLKIQTHASHPGEKHGHVVEIKCSLRLLKAVLPFNKCNDWVSEAAIHTEQKLYELVLCEMSLQHACWGVKHNGEIPWMNVPLSFC